MSTSNKAEISPFDEGSMLTAYGKTVNTSGVNLSAEFDAPAPADDAPAVAPVAAQPSANPPQNPQTPAQPEEKEFTRTIEVNGVKQVFKAKTEAELIDKLAAAQENATKKIVELKDKAKYKPSKDPDYQPIEVKPRVLTLQEKADLINLYKTDPQAAVNQILQASLGMQAETLAETLASLNQMRQQQANQQAFSQFIAQHQDLASSNDAQAGQKIGEKIGAFLSKEGLPVSVNNLNYAYQQLLESGEIAAVAAPSSQSATPAADAGAPATPPQPDVRETPPPPVSIPVGSGQPAPRAAETDGVDVRKLQSMPLDKMRSELNRIFKQGHATPSR